MSKMIIKDTKKEHKCVVCGDSKDIMFVEAKYGKHKSKGYMCFDCFYKKVKELSKNESNN